LTPEPGACATVSGPEAEKITAEVIGDLAVQRGVDHPGSTKPP
jgi:hypothetical protein